MPPPREPRLVTTSLPGDAQMSLIFAILVVLIVALVVTAPYAQQGTRGTEYFLPAYAAAVCVVEITTGALLLATFRVQRSANLLVLALGYLLSGLLVPAWALTFPGVFDTLGLGGNLQATAWIAAIRRIGFAAAVLGFAVFGADARAEKPDRWIAWGLAALAAGIAASLWFGLYGSQALPALMADGRRTAAGWGYVPPVTILLYGLGIAALLRRRRSTLDIWMAVVLFSLLFEIVLLSYLAAGTRLSVGWWSGRIFGLFAAAIILIVLLAETAGNYVRLAEAAAAEMRVRRNRMTAMEALSASIAHEVNQPLGSIVTNANAGLRWLSRGQPDIAQARAALERIVEDGHRAGKVVSGIRTMFLNGVQERSSVDLASVIDEAVARCRSERTLAAMEIERDGPEDAVHVTCNATQILQVCTNLIENAVEATGSRTDAPRRLTIRVRRLDANEVETSFADNGHGVPARVAERMFEPFVSTKPDGMGMGLMFCRTVIEAHGGRLWHTPNRPAGAIFHFTLPSAALPAPARGPQADD
jgi:signal transduction histidine kinase